MLAFDLPADAANHHRLRAFAAIALLLERAAATCGSKEAAEQTFPFLSAYAQEIARVGKPDEFRGAIRAWELRSREHLPLAALRDAGFGDDDFDALMTVGLIDVDARFGLVFETFQVGSPRRATWGLIESWFRASGRDARPVLRRLLDAGLVRVTQPDLPRLEWPLEVPPVVADALRGDPPREFTARTALPRTTDLLLPDPVVRFIDECVSAIGSGEASLIVLRGPGGSGRSSIVGAVASALGRGLLQCEGKPERESWTSATLLGRLLNAIPTFSASLGPGEVLDVPEGGQSDAAALITARRGAIRSSRVLRLDLEFPSPALRQAIWRKALSSASPDRTEQWAQSFRLGAGRISRIAAEAALAARSRGETVPETRDVRAALRAEGVRALESLATRVELPSKDWSRLCVATETLSELRTLEARCRHRERLAEAGAGGPGAPHVGVRALFKGPSGTGKTLAALLLGGVLAKDVYRVDLAGLVSKYIGETEKNLSQLFTTAEELDVVLLFDEGDALFARRTSVQSSNDRYANLETNYLLQRIESFDGIAIVTTNSGESIDPAFSRRMDVVVDFRPPEAGERLRIWQGHLPAAHAVGNELLREISGRCALTGGQIKNAVLHATVLALDAGGTISENHLESAVHREYRKSGANCPLRRASPARHGVS